MNETQAAYRTNGAMPDHREFCEPLTLDEYKALRRLRQLKGQGAQLVIVVFDGQRMKVRQVGKLEG